MPVYFVYRCTYNAPSEKHIRRFEYDTVLDWAKAVFKQLPTYDKGHEYAKQLMGGLEVYSLGGLFATDEETGARKPPKTMRDVHDWFHGMYVNEHHSGPHHIQILTDDDELEMAVYVFDDHYRKAHPGKADFLLHEGWELPEGDADAGWKPPASAEIRDLAGNPGEAKPKRGQPATYAAFLAHYDSCNLDDLGGGTCIPGLRVPDLARHILTNCADTELNGEWETLREALHKYLRSRKGEDAGFRAAIRKNPNDATSWGVYADWLQDRDEPAPGLQFLHGALKVADVRDGSIRPSRKPSKDMFRVTPHMVQGVFHTARWNKKTDLYHQWIFFDDRWAAAHPTLAAGILTFASRWDVLS